MLNCIELNPSTPATASIIWLHGLGADGTDFLPIAETLALPIAVRFVFPNAPKMPVTLNGGYIMPAWYDLFSSDFEGAHDAAGIRQSQEEVLTLIAHEQSLGISSTRILLAGFSQGGVIALHAALRCPQKLAGVMALSTYLPLADALVTPSQPANRGIPIFMAHGTEDSVIPLSTAKKSCKQLESLGYTVNWHPYVMDHSVIPAELADIRAFIIQALS